MKKTHAIRKQLSSLSILAVASLAFQTSVQSQTPTLDIHTSPVLVVQGQQGSHVVLQWADALKATNQWNTITNVVLGADPFEYCDFAAVPSSKRFYRAVSVPDNPSPTTLVWVSPGTFLMGSPTNEVDRWPNEGPQTQVTLTSGLFMGKFLVTQGEYLRLIGVNPSGFVLGNGYPQDWNRPVEQVTWVDATNYCGKLTEQEQSAGRLPTGWAYRLPTEAEWEYACRAGTTNRFNYGDDTGYTNLAIHAWYATNSNGQTHSVGQKPPNPWGLYDMHGNVNQFCQDYHGPYPGGSVVDFWGSGANSPHPARGGCWNSVDSGCRSATRYTMQSQNKGSDVGFRVVLAPGRP